MNSRRKKEKHQISKTKKLLSTLVLSSWIPIKCSTTCYEPHCNN